VGQAIVFRGLSSSRTVRRRQTTIVRATTAVPSPGVREHLMQAHGFAIVAFQFAKNDSGQNG
jgi:hypothetical protein